MAVEDAGGPVLHVRVADAQGLRLMPGGEIRLVITLRAADDPVGEAFGAKVTPWLEIPSNQAPQWRAREAVFTIPAERCFQAEFVDSAHLHMILMQKGFVQPQQTQPPPPPLPPAEGANPTVLAAGWAAALKQRGLTAALQTASTLQQHLAAPTPDRGEAVGALRLNVGKRLVCNSTGTVEDANWVQLVENETGEIGVAGQGQRIKGSLLLELAVSHLQAARQNQPPPPPPPPPDAAEVRPASEEEKEGTPLTAVLAQAASPRTSAEETSDSASESGGAASDTASTPSVSVRAADEETCQTFVEQPMPAPLPPPDLLTPQEIADLIAEGFSGGASGSDDRPATWLKQKPCSFLADSFDGDASVNIFTINNPATATKSSGSGRISDFFSKFTTPRAPKNNHLRPPTTVRQKLRSKLDPDLRQERQEIRKWRRWHEVFCVMNEIEQKLGEALGLLVQAASSMRRFGDSHGSLRDAPPVRLSAFFRDAMLYFKSEAEVPKRLEAHLGELERVADEFRSVSIEGIGHSLSTAIPGDGNDETGACEERSELQTACEDLQVDIAVLLESALMTAQQALAEYKKMHCRLELLVTEYESLCRLELDVSGPVFLPFVTEEAQMASTTLPEQAMQWALDFSQLVGAAAQGLDMLVRELEHRRRQLKGCNGELRTAMLQRAACSGQLTDSVGS